eukprot:Sspe_Gene.63236::Locus_36018_Transcript_1_1_Confidence_1.000_Length_458::g.63236::m.63236
MMNNDKNGGGCVGGGGGKTLFLSTGGEMGGGGGIVNPSRFEGGRGREEREREREHYVRRWERERECDGGRGGIPGLRGGSLSAFQEYIVVRWWKGGVADSTHARTHTH